MQKLVRGIHQFQSSIFGNQRELFARLAKGQRPETLFITCSDSRINPNLLTQTEPGELFILRNAGNIVPPYGSAPTGESATVEYAVSALEVRDVIICGHSHCGAMTALLEPSLMEKLPQMQGWLEHATITRRIIEASYQHLEGDARVTATVEENVLVQLEHLRTHPTVAERIQRGVLTLHGWVYKIETGDVFAYDAEHNAYLPIEKTQQTARPSDRLKQPRPI